MNKKTTTTSIKTSTATVERIHEKIVLLRYDKKIELETLETVQENLTALYEVGNIGYHSCLIIPSRYALPTIEGRKLIEKELSKFPYVAVVLTGLAQKILMNFVMSVIGKTKMRIFSNEESAMAWLLEKIQD
jgi:hypothetical protein